MVAQYTSFRQIPKNLSENTLYGFDIDQTLIDSNTYLGSGPFYFHLRNIFNSFVPKTTGLKDIISTFVMKNVAYESEEGFPDYIAKTQEKGETVLGITARKKELAEATQMHLSSVGIRLDNVHFTDGGDKGLFTVKLFELKKPSYFVFGDDHRPNVESVAKSMESIGVPCHAFEYRPHLNNPANDGFRPFNLWGAGLQLEKLVLNQTLVEDWDADKQTPSESIEEGRAYFQSAIQKIDEQINAGLLKL